MSDAPQRTARRVAQLRCHASSADGGAFQITSDAAIDIADHIEALTAERDRLRARVKELETPNLFWDMDNAECGTDDLRNLTDEPPEGIAVEVACARTLPGRYGITMPDMTAKLFDTRDEAEAAFRAALAAMEARDDD